MNVQHLKRVYFIGIGGIGMSAIARFFNERGATVHGYDRVATPLTQKLEEEGMIIHYSEDLNALDKETELIVYTPAIPSSNQELIWYRDQGYPVYKRSDVLQWITQSLFSITVAGTHGKTTISTMIAYLLRETGFGCNAFLGGVSVNYGRNYWSSERGVAVIEADEYDRSFLKLFPDIAVLTAMDADHLDIYGTAAEVESAFIQYTQNIKHNGTLIVKHGMSRTNELGGSEQVHYSLQNDAAACYARNIVQHNGGYRFDVVTHRGVIENVELQIGGMHNVENAVAAITVAVLLEISAAEIVKAMRGFRGVKRRFEYLMKTDRIVYIDDYAHHPEELRALISSAKRLFPGRRCVVVFQPHLYSRTRDFAEDFAHSLDLADEVLLLDIYPARELPIEGITSAILAKHMANPAHTLLSKEAVLEYVKRAPIELLITAGAGDIDQLVGPIKEILEKR